LANRLLEEGKAAAGTLDAVNKLFGELGGDVLGVVKDEYEQAGAADDSRIDAVVKILIEQRAEARKNKYFEKADELRTQLDDAGIVLEDKIDGTEWRWK